MLRLCKVESTPIPVLWVFRRISHARCAMQWDEPSPFTTPAVIQSPFGVVQELLKDSIQVLRQKCDSMIAEVEAFESGVDFDEAMP